MTLLNKDQRNAILVTHRAAHAAGYEALRAKTSGHPHDIIDYVLDDGRVVVVAITWDYGVHHPVPELCSPGMEFSQDL